jgi:hypothetical protein
VALFDSADLLLRLKRLLVRPASEDVPSPDADANTLYYALLQDAQLLVVLELATHVPDAMYTSAKLTTADSGVSYDFAAEPLGQYELRQSPTGRVLIPGPEWDMGADFVPNGSKIRFPGQKAKTFGNGPWARYVPTPGLLNGTNAPTLQPTFARILLPPRAAMLWATRGGLRDPKPYEDEFNEEFYGDLVKGKVGVLGALKNQVFLQGSAAVPSITGDDWWRFVDDGSGYSSG